MTVSYQTKNNFFELMRSHLNTQTIIRLPFFQLTHLYLLCVNCLLCQVLAKHWNLATITIQAKDAARHSFMEDAVEMPITLKLWLRVLTPVPWLYRNTPFNLKELRCITKKEKKRMQAIFVRFIVVWTLAGNSQARYWR